MDDYTDTAATFGDRLSLAREAQGMTPAQLARRLGVRRDTLEAWEADRSEPRANRLQMLAGLLNVSLIWLMTGEGPGGPNPNSVPADTSSEVGKLLAELRDIRLDQARVLERMARVEKRLKTQAGAA
ncbi:helix-turn-helix domain-containing protein [Limibaculum sp. M0105]|uniref:Helix-turn-helix domain-containing protein n=1 Tax=Thermohalobaculum xanthum TaxID=2753746 RepID=A0A8J7SAL3_9RHOB|nr:helix-turn-helix domain-containing protein [Thermohalobaculum xanthum]MBK0398417.1 helix-turn-helix domain-containing protein [Thermohalobaculum xanthum]